MYSTQVIERAIERYESKAQHRLTRIDPSRTDAWVAHLDARLAKQERDHPGEGEKYFWESASREEKLFIRNERVLSYIDFRYWAERYATIQKDGGGICKLIPWESQRIILDKMATREAEMHDRRDRGETVDGILIVGHKARQLGECLAKGTLVLRADLQWVPIETLSVGDMVISVDEHSPKGARARKMRTATVLATRMMYAPTQRIMLSDGTMLHATSNHPLLHRLRRGRACSWVDVQHTKVGDEIRQLTRPWAQSNFEDGWFGGLLDGEGSHRAKRASGPEICVSQVAGAVLERAKRYLHDKGFTFRTETDSRKPGVTSKFGKQPVHKLVMHSSAEIFQLLGQSRPTRFMQSNFWEGRELPNGAWSKVASIEPSVDQIVVNIETTTGTYIANGIVSHNTALGRCVCTHRITTQHHRRAMSASVDDDKIQEMYDRDKLIYDSLPWWMKPALRYDEKAAHVYFESLDSRVLYQVSSQKSGMGVSRQFDIGHLTELSTWINAAAVELDFFPTLPMSLSTFCLLESTAFGRGNWWHDFSERARHGYTARFIYVFIPWYAEVTKYHRTPPVTWIPSEVALKHASRVLETSPEFMGREVLLTRDQLYWWESTRADYMKGNNLTFFLTNYCATPEESFQHSGQSAFDPMLLDSLRTGVQRGVAYELRG